MKKTIAAIAITLALVVPAFAKKHQQSAPPAHDYSIGTMTRSFIQDHYDSSASVTVDGHTYTSYCTETGTSVDCSDTGGYFIYHVLGAGLDFSFVTDGWSSNVLEGALLKVEIASSETIPAIFQYRFVTIQQEINVIVSQQGTAGLLQVGTRGPLMCLPVKNELPARGVPDGPELGAIIDVCYDVSTMIGYENHAPVDTTGAPAAPDVSSLGPTAKLADLKLTPVTPTFTPAQQAQQHADCLKAAVDNPSIHCD
jgi:hypothetical protein